MRGKKTAGIIAFGLVASVGLASMFWSENGDEAGQSAAVASAKNMPDSTKVSDRELAPSDVIKIAEQDLSDRVAVSGELRPLSRAVVKAKVAGNITEVLVRPGQSVEEGDLLAKFDSDELNAELRRAEANLTAAQAQKLLADQTLTKSRALQRSNAISLSALEKAISEAAAAHANVAALEAQVETARTALSNTNVKSPISGLVATRSVDIGETVANGADLLTVVDNSAFEAQVLVATRDVALLQIGQRAELTIDGLPNRQVVARVGRISPVANAGTRFVPVYLHLKNSEGQLWGGMFASGTVTVREKSHVIAVPETALREGRNGKKYVLTVSDGRLQRRDVVTGAAWGNGHLLEINEGLRPGDVVLKAPIAGVVAGTSVSVTPLRGGDPT